MKKEAIIFFIMLASSIVLINPTIEWDEYVYLAHAKYFLGQSPYFESFRAPVMALISMPLAYFFPSNLEKIAIPIMSTAILALFFISMYLLAKDFKPMIILLCFPIFVQYTQKLMAETLLASLAILSVYFMKNYLEKHKLLSFILSFLMASLAFLTKYPLGIMLPIIGLIYLALEKKDSLLKKARNLFLGAITFILPILVWVKYITLNEIIRGLNFVSVESGFFFYLQNILIIIGATLVLLLFIKNYKFEKKDLLFIIPALLIFLVFQAIKHKEARYLIPALPFISIFLAKISEKSKYFMPIIIVCFILSTIALMSLNALTCDDSKGYEKIRDFVKEEGIGVTLSNFWPIHAYYSNGPVWHICEPCEFEQDIIDQNAEYIAIFSYSPCAKTNYSKYELVKTINEGCGTIDIYKI